MRVLIVDDHPLIAEGLAVAMKDLDASLETRHAEDSEQAFAALADGAAYDLILLDLALPGLHGLDLLARVRERAPETPVVVISASDQSDTVHAALDGGAMGFISKRSSTPVLLRALQLVLSGGVYVPPQVLAALPRHPLAAAASAAPAGAPLGSVTLQKIGLTGRQADVLALLVEGKSTKVICRELNISEGTAKAHISAILRALHVNNRTQVLFALSQLGVQVPGLLHR